MYKLKIYRWLIDLLRNHPKGLTFRQIRNWWDSPSCPVEDPFELNIRTFHRYKREIEKLFGIKIECKHEYDRYVYKVKGLESTNISVLMLEDYVAFAQTSDELVEIKIQASGTAIDWLERLLSDSDYDESDPVNGVVTFEFESALDEELSRLLLPYADSMVIKKPDILAAKMRDLLNASLQHLDKQA